MDRSKDALARVDGWPVANAAVAVVRAGEVVATRGDLARGFALASVTKLLSAYAVLVAVEEGALELDDPAGPGADAGSTVAHLLAHAGGVAPDEPRLAAAPGTRRIYSNAGYDVLGALVAERTGMAFAHYLAEAVFEPLGMGSAVLDGSPASGARASAGDLVRFAAELQEPRLLDRSTHARATGVAFPGLTGVLPGFGRQEPNDWGLGFEIRDAKAPHWTGVRNSPRTFGHFGRAGTFVWVDPDAGLACVCLTDRDFGPWAVEAWPPLSDGVLDRYAA